MNIKQIVNLASFYAKKVKNGEFRPNRAKQEIKSANQTCFMHLKNNQKAGFLAESQTQRGLDGLRGLRGLNGLSGLRGVRGLSGVRTKGVHLAEYGRSMVEMLGVLAVIGVLSVAGMMGYRYAMDKYRSNDIVYEVNLRATDIWNRYQRMPLPEPSESGKDFLEFAQTTASGFPIYMQSKPDVAFRVFVGEVSPRICKSVLNMPLIDVIKGLQFVQVNGTKYTGSVDICGDINGDIQNEMVFTIFLNSESDSLINENCVEDGDCSSCCGTPTCDENTLTCRDECSGNASTPYCNQEQCACVECLTPKDCAEKGANYTCSEITNTCVEVPAECAFGKEFRTPNGVCVPCSNPNNFLVSLTPFENSALNFKDTKSGKEQCAACNNPTRYYGDVDDEKAYCSYACTNGYTYQASDGAGCVPCSDTDIHLISGDSVSKTQCDACKDHFWFRSNDGSRYYCTSTKHCSENEYQESNQGLCINCTSTSPQTAYVANGDISTNVSKDYFIDSCNHCTNKKARAFNKGYMYCIPDCQQPKNAPTTCDNPETCNRVWQNTWGQCIPCNDTQKSTEIYVDDEVGKALCLACGRKLVEYTSSKMYCIYDQPCENGQFRGKDGLCRSCSYIPGIVVDESDTTCETNCTSETMEREKRLNKNGQWYCVPKCKENQIHDYEGYCKDCDDYKEFSPFVLSDCEEKCLGTRMLFGEYCGRTTCPADGVYYKGQTGVCNLCADETTGNVGANTMAIESCLACGNRMINGHFCYMVNPGVRGICSSLDGPLIDDLNEDIKVKAQPYLNGEHDGELFRGNDYKCYSCMDEGVAPKTSSAQCSLCSNRRYDTNSSCSYGKCEETHQFLDTNNTCRDCSEKNVAVNPNEDNLCNSCDNRREMTLGNNATNNLTAKCVEECTLGLWQDSNGNCLLCGEGGNRAIGTDSESIALCNSCDNRKAIASTNADGVITGYTCKIQ